MVQLTSIASKIIALASVANAACHYGTTYFPREPNVAIGAFGYTGLTGPLNWYGLNTSSNKLCATGRNQSPINLNSSINMVPGSVARLNVDHYPTGSKLENLGTTVEVPANGTITLDGKIYKLAQFHFHTPSEHRVNFEYFPMEMHFVFQAADKSMAVVAFLISLGTADPLLTSIFTYAGEVPKPGQVTLTGPLDFTNIQHHLESSPIYKYSGSLTTPPCSESIQWIISTKSLQIDQGTYDKVKSVVRFNSRYTQNTLGSVNLLQNIANELAKN